MFADALASGGALVVIDRTTDQIIGSSRYNLPDPASGRAEIGWSYLARSYWGGSWNAVVKDLLLTHAFRFVDTVYFRVGEDNLRSRRAVEKIGGILTGETEAVQMADGTTVRHVVLQIEKADFHPL